VWGRDLKKTPKKKKKKKKEKKKKKKKREPPFVLAIGRVFMPYTSRARVSGGRKEWGKKNVSSRKKKQEPVLA